jgi:hypothetical protein
MPVTHMLKAQLVKHAEHRGPADGRPAELTMTPGITLLRPYR